MSIQRYEPTEWGEMDADAEGGWICYADHVAAVEQEAAVWHAAAEYAIREQAEAMRAACIAAVENARQSLYTHYRINCEGEPVGIKTDWSKHRNCDPIEDILTALREVQP